jgi:hypothetical protein
MADTIPQRRRLTTQKQLTQRPVTAPRSSSTTPLKHWTWIAQLKLPRATTLTAWSITLPRVTTPPRRRRMTTHAAPSSEAHTPRLLSITLFLSTYCTDFPKYYSVPSCYTEAPADYYTESAKYYSAPIYTTITEAAKYWAARTYCTEVALSYYAEQEYYTDAPVH